MNLTELTCTAGLFLVTVVCNSNLCNGLSVRDFWSHKINLKFIYVIEFPLENVDVMLSLSAEDGLFQLLRVLYNNCRILCRSTVEKFSEFLLILLLLSLDCCTELRLREFGRCKCVLATCTEGLTNLNALKFNGATYITGLHLRNLLSLLSCSCIDNGNSLFITGLRIIKIHTLFESTGHNFEVSNISQVLLQSGLVEEQ